METVLQASKIIHFGNARYTRKKTSCGLDNSYSDSVSIEKVNCIDCIKNLLLRMKKLKLPDNSKTPLWIKKIEELEKADKENA